MSYLKAQKKFVLGEYWCCSSENVIGNQTLECRLSKRTLRGLCLKTKTLSLCLHVLFSDRNGIKTRNINLRKQFYAPEDAKTDMVAVFFKFGILQKLNMED